MITSTDTIVNLSSEAELSTEDLFECWDSYCAGMQEDVNNLDDITPEEDIVDDGSMYSMADQQCWNWYYRELRMATHGGARM